MYTYVSRFEKRPLHGQDQISRLGTEQSTVSALSVATCCALIALLILRYALLKVPNMLSVM